MTHQYNQTNHVQVPYLCCYNVHVCNKMGEGRVLNVRFVIILLCLDSLLRAANELVHEQVYQQIIYDNDWLSHYRMSRFGHFIKIDSLRIIPSCYCCEVRGSSFEQMHINCQTISNQYETKCRLVTKVTKIWKPNIRYWFEIVFPMYQNIISEQVKKGERCVRYEIQLLRNIYIKCRWIDN